MYLNSRALHLNVAAIFAGIYSCSSSTSGQFKACPLSYLSRLSKPIPIFSLYNRGFGFISHASEPTVEDNIKNHGEEEEECCDFSDKLRKKIEEHGIKYSSCTPGQFHLLICPKCNGGKSKERSLSFYTAPNKNLSLWRCFADECGWAGKVLLDSAVNSGGNQHGKNNSFRQMTEKGLKLEPLDDELIAYFSERMISRETLEKNHVMKISGEKIIAFTYRRNKIIVGCKYRSLEKRFWQERGTEQIFYGIDDIRETDEIIVVEGEVDKLSMEEAGITNCVAVPGGAPQKVSKELPAMEKDRGFQYVWNCKEYFDKASRIILATDADAPGQSLAEELARRLGKERCWRVCWPKRDEFSSFKDANEVLKELGPNSLRDIIYKSELLSMDKCPRTQPRCP